MRSRLRLALLGALLSTLAACGGGGGGASAGAAPAAGTGSGGTANPAATSESPGVVTLSGTARYESVPAQADGTGLNYAGTVARPVRGATVQLLDAAGNLIATTVTDAAGGYAFALAAARDVQVRVRAEHRRSGAGGASYDISVRDNTASNALYVLDSGVFTASGAATRDLLAASGWGGNGYTGTRAAAPFAILDVAYQGVQKLLSADPAASLPALRMFWSRNNVPSDGDTSLGQIGTSYFTATDGGSGTPALYLLGAENVDTDEYDDHVVAHEFGHYLQYALSRDDSIGGPHSEGDKLDMRVAFSEGFGNAWSGLQLGSPLYFDSQGTRQNAGFAFSVADAPDGVQRPRGWYSEDSLQYLLYSAHQQPSLGFGAIHAALLRLRASPVFSSAYSMAAALKAAAPSAAAVVDGLWRGQDILGSDAYGSGETNAGGVLDTVPIYRSQNSGPFCLRSTAGIYNKLGNTVFVSFSVTAGSHTITLSRNGGSPAGADPDFTLLRNDGGIVHANAQTGDAESLTVTLPAGTHVLALTDYNLDAGETRCVDLLVN